MSAIYGRVGTKAPEGFKELFETEYRKKCRIDRYSYLEKSGDLTASFGEALQYITPESRDEGLPLSSGSLLFTADTILDNREYVAGKISELIPSCSAKDLLGQPDGVLMFSLIQACPQDYAKHFLGVYSYALYDASSHILTLTVDQVAERCLYYYMDDSQVVFSTILSPLVKWCHASVSEDYLKDYLAAPGLMPSIVSDLSPFTNIYMLNPGSQVHFNFSETGIRKTEDFYIDWTTGRGITDGAIGSFVKHSHPQDYLTDFRAIYSECVKSACRTGENVALSLSSGFDSSSVGVLAAKALQEQGKKLYTFTYVPYEKPAADRNKNNIHDETAAVKEIGAMYPNMDQEFVNNNGRNCVEQLQDITNTLELPIKAVANMPSLFEIFDKAREKSCRIVLTGQAGNASVSCGYIDHILFDIYLHHNYFRLISYLFKFSKDVGESRRQALRGTFRMFRYEKKQLKKSLTGQSHISPDLYDWVNADAFKDYDPAARFNLSGSSLTESTLNYRQPAREFLTSRIAHSYLGAYETKAGLRYGVVLRDPTRDPRIIWFCYNLPYHLFAYRGRTRWLIREGMKDLLPASITSNQIRYGVQNSDCGRRLLRDREALNSLMDSQKTAAMSHTSSAISALYTSARMPHLPNDTTSDLSLEQELEFLTAMGWLSFLNITL